MTNKNTLASIYAGQFPWLTPLDIAAGNSRFPPGAKQSQQIAQQIGNIVDKCVCSCWW